MQIQRLTLTRLQKQEASLERQPITGVIVTRQGLLKFHFCLYDLDGPYQNGFYHGLLELHENYPFNAPKLYFYTPNGRFECNMPICTSFTNYHQQSWTSAWNVRTLITATISFMYSQEPSYGCKTDTEQQRKDYANNSMEFNLKNQLFVQLFKQKLEKINKLPNSHIESQIEQIEQIKQIKQEQPQKQLFNNNEVDLDPNPKKDNERNKQIKLGILTLVGCTFAGLIVYGIRKFL